MSTQSGSLKSYLSYIQYHVALWELRQVNPKVIQIITTWQTHILRLHNHQKCYILVSHFIWKAFLHTFCRWRNGQIYPRRRSVLHCSFHSPDRPCSEIHSAHFTLIPEIQSFPTLKASEYSSRAKTKIGTVQYRPDLCLPMATKAAPSHHKNPLKDCKSERQPKSILLLMFLPEQVVCFPLQLPFAWQVLLSDPLRLNPLLQVNLTMPWYVKSIPCIVPFVGSDKGGQLLSRK